MSANNDMTTYMSLQSLGAGLRLLCLFRCQDALTAFQRLPPSQRDTGALSRNRARHSPPSPLHNTQCMRPVEPDSAAAWFRRSCVSFFLKSWRAPGGPRVCPSSGAAGWAGLHERSPHSQLPSRCPVHSSLIKCDGPLHDPRLLHH